MRSATFSSYHLQFKQPVLTSRGEMKVKNGYIIKVSEKNITGTGECSFIEGLSPDNLERYEEKLKEICETIHQSQFDVAEFPSIQFGLETALLDLKNGGTKALFPSSFTSGNKQIPINGLVWMGKKEFMLHQIKQKLKAGFTCIKIKVGAIDFAEEVNLLEFIRQKYPAEVIEIRLDANGAFNNSEALQKVEILSQFNIQSIEQPIKPKQLEFMRVLCANSPIPIALDEELIGVKGTVQDDILDMVKPAFIVLKPSLLGGFDACNQWIDKAEHRNIGWWVTSALESNIGLNAIAQWVATQKNEFVQGLGTGNLYANNISSPLYIRNGCLGYNPELTWGQSF